MQQQETVAVSPGEESRTMHRWSTLPPNAQGTQDARIHCITLLKVVESRLP